MTAVSLSPDEWDFLTAYTEKELTRKTVLLSKCYRNDRTMCGSTSIIRRLLTPHDLHIQSPEQ